MVLTPFKDNATQRLISIIAMITGIVMMIFTPALAVTVINIFIFGAIVALFGFVYLLDAQ